MSVFDNCYDFSSEDWKFLNDVEPLKYIPYWLEGIVRTLFFIWKSSVILFRKKNRHDMNKKIIFIVGTDNNRKALDPVAEKIDQSDRLYVSYHNYFKSDVYVSSLMFYFIGIIVSPYIGYLFIFKASKYQRYSMLRRLDQYLVASSGVFVWWLWLKWNKPSAIVFSNDHSSWTRTMMKAAKRNNIKTFFIPHSSTGENPPLLIVDVMFSDGFIQTSMYDLDKTDCKVFEIGAIRYEEMVQVSSAYADEQAVVVAFNNLDSLDFIQSILNDLSCLDGWRVYVRPHPADYLRFNEINKISDSLGLVYSSPESPVASYLSKAKFMLAGVSSIHTDALMIGMTIVSLKTWYSVDYYGYLKNGFMKLIDNVADIDEVLNEPPSFDISALNIHVKKQHSKPSVVAAIELRKLLEG